MVEREAIKQGLPSDQMKKHDMEIIMAQPEKEVRNEQQGHEQYEEARAEDSASIDTNDVDRYMAELEHEQAEVQQQEGESEGESVVVSVAELEAIPQALPSQAGRETSGQNMQRALVGSGREVEGEVE